MKKNKVFFGAAALVLTSLALGGCSSLTDAKKKPLAGTRESVLELTRKIDPDNAALNAEGFVAPAPWKNDFWPQAGGYPNHSMQELALSEGALKQVWSANIGKGGSDRLPLTTQPIVADGRIFTVDAEAVLSAFSIKDGARLWKASIAPPGKHESIIGGGLAFSNGKLFATNGYNEVLCLTPEDGKVVWRVAVTAPARSAPTVVDDRLFVTTMDNHVYAMRVADGAILWDYTGVSEAAGLIGAASPAVSDNIVVPVFSSGEIYALHAENGSVAWSDSLAASTGITGGLSGLSDIRGLPVIDKGVIFAVSFDGRLAAIDERSGSHIWQRDIGSGVTPWLAGNHLFVLSTDNELVSLGRDNGAISWVLSLPRWRKPEDHKDPLFWTAPVLAGNRLFITGTAGDLVEVSADAGKMIRTTHLDKPVSIDPIVAGGTLYLLSDDGTLMAFQ